MSRHLPHSALGLLLLLTVLVALVGAGLAVAVAAVGDRMDFTATWELQEDSDVTVEVSRKGDDYAVAFRRQGDGWRRTASARLVDRFQLAGRLDPATPQSGHNGDLRLVATAPAQTALSIARIDNDTVSVGVRPPDASTWQDVGTFTRSSIFSDPYRAAGLIVLFVVATMAIVLVLEISTGGRAREGGRRGARRVAVRLTVVLAALALLVTLLSGQPVVAIAVAIILFALWLVNLVKWLPAEVTSVGEFLGAVFSRDLRRQYRADVAERDTQAVRGAELEKKLREVRGKRSETP
jgi:hypothetical protein